MFGHDLGADQVTWRAAGTLIGRSWAWGFDAVAAAGHSRPIPGQYHRSGVACRRPRPVPAGVLYRLVRIERGLAGAHRGRPASRLVCAAAGATGSRGVQCAAGASHRLAMPPRTPLLCIAPGRQPPRCAGSRCWNAPDAAGTKMVRQWAGDWGLRRPGWSFPGPGPADGGTFGSGSRGSLRARPGLREPRPPGRQNATGHRDGLTGARPTGSPAEHRVCPLQPCATARP